MEKEEIDLMIAENQIAFDLDGGENVLEETTLFSKPLLKPKNNDWIKKEVLFVGVKCNHFNISSDFSNMLLCGKKMIDWIMLAGRNCESIIVNDGEDLIDRLIRLNTDKKIIAVFYSDTPLLDKVTFEHICNYFSSHACNYLKLNRGFLVRSDFLKFSTQFVQGNNFLQEKNLYVVENSKDLNFVAGALYNKILNYHISNGVIIYGQNTVFIDGDVEIESGVIIEPNNIISGQSIIEKDCVIESGNIIKNSIIGQNCRLKSSYIENSKISNGTVVEPYSKIINEEIK